MNSSHTVHNRSPAGLPTVLIIDDDPGVRIGLERLLDAKYQVETRDCFEEGFSFIKQHQPDAVILDLCLPDRPGLEGLSVIRKFDHTLPVLILTGYPSMDSAVTALRTGATDYLEKPVPASVLEQRLKSALTRSGHKLKSPTRILDQSPKPVTSTESEDILEMLHDFSNPLTSLSLLVTMLPHTSDQSRGTSPEESGNPLDNISAEMANSVHYLMTLVDFWRDTELRRKRDQPPVSVDKILRMLQKQTLNKIRAAGIEFSCLVQGSEPIYVRLDPVLLLRILNNLVDNAIAASPPKTGKISVVAKRVGSRCIIIVQDNGHGIAQEHMPHLFKKNWTTKTTGTNHGLGLSLVEKIVRRIQGSVFFCSQENKGSSFVINLPNLPGQSY